MPSVSDQLRELKELCHRCESIVPHVEACASAFGNSLSAGGKVLSCGNGGSAADAMHLVEELLGRYRNKRPALPAICLNSDPTVLTCIGNDWDFETVFSRQIEALGRPGDILAGFTTSGNSPNILRAFQAACQRGVIVVGFLGNGGGKAKDLCDFSIVVPSSNTSRIQEIHTWALHAILEHIDEIFTPDASRPVNT